MRDNLVSYINAWGTRAQQVSLVGEKKGNESLSGWDSQFTDINEVYY